VPQGILSVWPLQLSAILGAIAGDGFSYWLGHRYHEEILRRWPLNRHPELIARSEAFFHRHGAKSVFLGRFTPVVACVHLGADAVYVPLPSWRDWVEREQPFVGQFEIVEMFFQSSIDRIFYHVLTVVEAVSPGS
jgi:SNARE associated Golgi protein